jgi:hypothetical protein
LTEPFNPNSVRVLVPVTVRGPRKTHEFGFALDTGSNRTTLRPELMRLLGFDLTNPVQVDRFRSVTGRGEAGAFVAPFVSAPGVTHNNFVIHAQALSTGLTVDGLLGLDFARGRIALRPPRAWWAFWR